MSFDAEKVTKEIVQWIRDWFEENGKGCKAVVGQGECLRCDDAERRTV